MEGYEAVRIREIMEKLETVDDHEARDNLKKQLPHGVFLTRDCKRAFNIADVHNQIDEHDRMLTSLEQRVALLFPIVLYDASNTKNDMDHFIGRLKSLEFRVNTLLSGQQQVRSTTLEELQEEMKNIKSFVS